jgi:hypothetical protein
MSVHRRANKFGNVVFTKLAIQLDNMSTEKRTSDQRGGNEVLFALEILTGESGNQLE